MADDLAQRLRPPALLRLHGPLPWAAATAANLADWQAVRAGGLARLRLFEPAAEVLSLGRRSADGGLDAAARAEAEARGLPRALDDRGGRATLHLPGQAVALVALPLPRERVAAFVAAWLGALAAALAAQGVAAELGAGERLGLWRGPDKLASVGMRHQGGVLRHGLALNVAVAADRARGLVLCGQDTRALATIAAPEVAAPGLVTAWCARLGLAALAAWSDARGRRAGGDLAPGAAAPGA